MGGILSTESHKVKVNRIPAGKQKNGWGNIQRGKPSFERRMLEIKVSQMVSYK